MKLVMARCVWRKYILMNKTCRRLRKWMSMKVVRWWWWGANRKVRVISLSSLSSPIEWLAHTFRWDNRKFEAFSFSAIRFAFKNLSARCATSNFPWEILKSLNWNGSFHKDLKQFTRLVIKLYFQLFPPSCRKRRVLQFTQWERHNHGRHFFPPPHVPTSNCSRWCIAPEVGKQTEICLWKKN